jgi:hypothetical protein
VATNAIFGTKVVIVENAPIVKTEAIEFCMGHSSPKVATVPSSLFPLRNSS